MSHLMELGDNKKIQRSSSESMLTKIKNRKRKTTQPTQTSKHQRPKNKNPPQKRKKSTVNQSKIW